MIHTIKHSSGTFGSEITPPGSKSISNRLLLLKYVYGLDIEIENISTANDTQLFLRILEQLEQNDNVTEVNFEDAGTTSRFLTTALAFSEGTFTLDGSARLRNRPLRPLIKALNELGADINGDRFPLTVHGRSVSKKNTLTLDLDVSESSQFASSVLMILPKLVENATIRLKGDLVSLPYIEMTLSIMEKLGFAYEQDFKEIRYSGYSPVQMSKWIVEPDYSSLAFWVGIVALSKGGSIFVPSAAYSESIQGDSMIIDRSVSNGVIDIEEKNGGIQITSSIRHKQKKMINLDYSECPDLAIPELIMYSALGHHCRFTGTNTLDLKESPRLQVLTKELSPFNISIRSGLGMHHTEGEFTIPKGPIRVHAQNDHRVAMGFAMLGIVTPITIENADSVRKSYPSFWDDLRKVNFDVT